MTRLTRRGAVHNARSVENATIVQEVLSGIRSPKQFASLAQRLVGGFVIIHPTTADCVAAARLRNQCLAKGLNVSGPDCLIATPAIAGRHQLFALDDNFVQIAAVSNLKILAVEDV